MKKYFYEDKIKALIDAPIEDENISGYVGLTTEAIKSLIDIGHLPPPIDEPGRFFFSPTKMCMERIFGHQKAQQQEDFNKSHGGINPRALETARFYAAMRDRENYMAKSLGLSQFIFSYPDLERIDQYASIHELFEDDNNEAHFKPDGLYYYLTVTKKYSDVEIASLIKEALKRKGVVMPLRNSIFDLMQGQVMLPRQLRLGTDEFFIQIDPKSGISYEHFASIHPQCEFSRARLNNLLHL